MSDTNSLPFEFDPTDPAPDWTRARKVHDWRNHVGENTKKVWATLTAEQRTAVALDADEAASAEHWD